MVSLTHWMFDNDSKTGFFEHLNQINNKMLLIILVVLLLCTLLFISEPVFAAPQFDMAPNVSPNTPITPSTTTTTTPSTTTTTPSTTTTPNKSGYLWPAPDAKCWTTYPGHNPPGAIDVQAKMGSTVVAMVDGTVKIANNTCPVKSAGINDSCPPGIGCGNYVQLQHKEDPSISSYYCHLSNPTVKVGEEVTAGQIIGISGSSGKSSGPHLHVHLNSKGNLTLETIFADKKCVGRSRSDDDIYDIYDDVSIFG